MRRRYFASGLLAGILATLGIAVMVWLVIAYTGIYNVAATDEHSDPMRWTLETTMKRSVAYRAVDADLADTATPGMMAEGGSAYGEYCAHCHGGPGAEAAEWTKGMRPQPPALVEEAGEWTPGELHWIIENGIKMTGMPAFGPYHEPAEIRALAVFVSRLPGLSAEDYAGLTQGSGHDQSDAEAAPEPSNGGN